MSGHMMKKRTFNALWVFEVSVGIVFLLTSLYNGLGLVMSIQLVAVWFISVSIMHVVMVCIRITGHKWPDRIMLKTITIGPGDDKK